jgi:hypothetical protein
MSRGISISCHAYILVLSIFPLFAYEIILYGNVDSIHLEAKALPFKEPEKAHSTEQFAGAQHEIRIKKT